MKSRTTRVYHFDNDITLSSYTESNENNLKVYSNPSNGIVIIDSEAEIELAQVYDLKDRILQNYVMLSDCRSVTEIDITNFDSGIYFLKLIMENGEILTKKIVKE